MSEGRLSEFLQEISQDLDRSVKFWTDNSHDQENGGFFNCLGEKGEVYDDLKHVWLQGRQVWTYCRLYNECERFRTSEIIQAAIRGGEFLMKHAKVSSSSQKCALVLTRDGKPIKVQRTVFSECFYVMGMSELSRATGEKQYRNEALTMMDQIVHWVMEDNTELRFGTPTLPGQVPVSSLAIPMMLLCLIDQLETSVPDLGEKYSYVSEWSLKYALMHVQRDGTVILENVSPDGKELPGSVGRLMLPGHSIEAGWFLLQYARKKGIEDLKKTAIEKFILNPFSYGWDKEYGGLLYFLDVDGYSPTQLEWDMKLWWAHNEAMIAFLIAYQETKDTSFLDKFAHVFDYSYAKFVDKENGEWYGYLSREGKVSLRFKGGPWKGCFHVERCLLMCENILKNLIQNKV
ncbi:hypothetical protein CHS0354_038351 [Potamilus streckersoni]|uniref:N-acylglucosamine 2-epimerase n=1 Tax=Potamilus streckersoni TaxID=2493646 RepID=A0AAE0VQ34_9BIVA|nr:hypothetical protein CHS0354_038351 [Potamilus streckersoni]